MGGFLKKGMSQGLNAKEGINFIERQKSLEGYMISSKGVATMTSGFEKYVDARIT